MGVPRSDVPELSLVKPRMAEEGIQSPVGFNGYQRVTTRAWLLGWNLNSGKDPETPRRTGPDQNATGLVGHSGFGDGLHLTQFGRFDPNLSR